MSVFLIQRINCKLSKMCSVHKLNFKHKNNLQVRFFLVLSFYLMLSQRGLTIQITWNVPTWNVFYKSNSCLTVSVVFKGSKYPYSTKQGVVLKHWHVSHLEVISVRNVQYLVARCQIPKTSAMAVFFQWHCHTWLNMFE